MRILPLLLILNLLLEFCAVALASEPTKERLVLMPLRLSDEDKSLKGAMEIALSEGLQQAYTVFSGDQVQQKAKEIFNNESKLASKECDDTKCMQDIAIAFQSELIAIANVTKRDNGYFLALSIQNIFDNKIVYSRSIALEKTNSFAVIEQLKKLANQYDMKPVYYPTNIIEKRNETTDDIYISKSKGLMWQDNKETETLKKTWQEAISYCQELTLAGYNDWILPEKNLLEYPGASFVHNVNDIYWSSTSTSESEASRIYNHSSTDGNKNDKWNVRCMRVPEEIEPYYPSLPNHIKERLKNNRKVPIANFMVQNQKTTNKTWKEAVEYCNVLDLDGYHDWFLPDEKTLFSLFYRDKIPEYSTKELYWTSSVTFKDISSVAIGKSQKNGYIRAIDQTPIDSLENVLCVRIQDNEDLIWNKAKQQNSIESYTSYLESFPNGKYAPLAALKIKKLTLNTNVWVDKSTHLMWQDDQEIKRNNKDWHEAMDYCENLGLNDYTDWRLPNMEELKSLAYKREYLKHLAPLSHWSSTPKKDKESSAYLIKIGSKNWQSTLKEAEAPVRCVRDYKE